ncbi:MAG: hypothetical protein RLZZ397_426 [Pseudomonadota bacterium]|jgi:TRAP-type mannitol/chloroaromatic compound transport system permease small subunit
MNTWLSFSRAIDRLNHWVGKASLWLILATTLISAANAIVRKVFNFSSNAYLEIQWYLFAAVFLLAAGYVFMHNAHVRIDSLSSKFSPKTRNWIDVVGISVVLLPFCLLMVILSWPLFVQAYVSGELSSNAGGLIRWPAYFLMPAGFSLLGLQGVSELIKRVAYLRGQGPDVLAHHHDAAESLVASDVRGDAS